MKICFLTFAHSSHSIGGIERYLDNVVSRLRNNGEEIHILTSTYDKMGIDRSKNLTVYKMPFMRTDKGSKTRKGRFLYNYLKKIIPREGIDLISAQNFYRALHPSFALSVNLASMETNTPLIQRMHAHCTNELEESIVRDLYWDKIIGVSNNVTESAYKIGVPVKKLTTIYPGVDTKAFRPGLDRDWLRERIGIKEGDILLLHASRITGSRRFDVLEEKGVGTLLKAFSIVNQSFDNVKLLIAAATPPPTWYGRFQESIKRIKDIASLYGVGKDVYVDKFNMYDMPLVYNGSDIFVMASRMETFGIVYTEAMACGIPVIGTSVGGVPEVINNGDNGYLLEPDSPVELAKRIVWFVRDSNKRKRYGRKGRKSVLEKFDLDTTINRLYDVYESMENGKVVI